MLNFKAITLEDKNIYENYLFDDKERGCEFSFANVYTWGQQKIALLHGHLVLLANFYGRTCYPYPMGQGNKQPVLDAILADAKKRGIPCCITGLDEKDKQTMEELYPEKFCFEYDKNSFDYVYAIDDLADLKGRKYHRKRNHFKRFQTTFPNYRVKPLTEENLPLAEQFSQSWYKHRLLEHPEDDYNLERAALHTALRDYKDLNMEGILLLHGEEVLAITLGSRISSDTFDVHFEKARTDIEGAYPAINCEFASYIRDKYPEIKYLNREEDMGIPGLRRAKESYFPHHQIEKYRAYSLEDLRIDEASEAQFPALKDLWQTTFGDTDEFLNAFYSTAFSPERCRCVTIGKKIAASLYWFHCEYENKRIAYIYAVATAEAFRGQGFARRLLQNTHSHLISLSYDGAVLVPNGQKLFEFYEKFGYQTCSYVKEFTAEPVTTLNVTENTQKDSLSDEENDEFSLRQITKEDYATLRRQFLPKHSVIQENENLDFLETQAKFYAGEDFVMAACTEESVPIEDVSHEKILHCAELLGNASHAPEILSALGCTKGRFRTPGDETAFAMYRSLTDNEVLPPKYFGLAFD
ncbi:MAG: GNAT family N-acetyltransferase [Lachnospiraceae bacterium]|nr:GNAT family N-acetyltransferase [Lachnospiraceae bacterium]